MKINELRIGNLIRFNNYIQPESIVNVNARFFSSFAGGRATSEMNPSEEISNYYSGIPLTPEILEKAGFEPAYGYYVIGSDTISICYSQNEGLWATFILGDNKINNILFVHQLQNLYYALTSEELNIQL